MEGSAHRSPRWLRQHGRDVLTFYHPDVLDTHYGGYVAQLDERDGHVYDASTKHLVATARAVHNFAVGVRMDAPVWCRAAAEHGLSFLRNGHWDPVNEGYDWVLDGRETVDATRHCYGHAFVLLAGARAHQADIAGGRETMDRADEAIDEHFWEPSRGLCADEASPEWDLSPYRGLNANMHACEALIAAYEATNRRRFLDRAWSIAGTVTRELTDDAGRLWEHYTTDWRRDRTYNRDRPAHRFRPWGYQPGHHVEWAKLLCLLHSHDPEEWAVRRAKELFDVAVDMGWDEEYGGFFYTVDGDGDPVIADKYGWAHAEGIGAAALLSRHDESYLDWYDRLWDYADTHLVNSRHGNWYERVTREGEREEPNHGIAVEPGYHPLTNAWIATRAFESRDS